MARDNNKAAGEDDMDAVAEKDRLVAELPEPRARIGLIIPSVNRMTEPQFNHYAPGRPRRFGGARPGRRSAE